MSIRANRLRKKALKFWEQAQARSGASLNGVGLNGSRQDAKSERLFAEVIRATRKAIELDPGNADDYYLLYCTLEAAGDVDEAREACLQALEIDPHHSKAKLAMARVYRREAYALGKAAKAATREARAAHRGSACAIPMAPKAKRLHEEAIEAIRRAIELEPDVSGSYYTLYWNLACLGLYEEGLEACQNALSLDPMSRKAQQGLAWCFQRMRQYENALDAYRRARDLGVNSSRFWNDMGECLIRADRDDERIAHYEAAVEEHPENKKLLRGLYLAYARAERWEDALPLAEKVVELGGDHHACIAVANAQEALGNRDEARKAFELAVARAGASVDPFIRLSKWHQKSGDSARAISILREAARQDIVDSMEAYSLGKVFKAMGEMKDALTAFERAYALEPGLAFYAASVAELQEALGNEAQAAEFYRIAIRESRRFIEKHEGEAASIPSEYPEGHRMHPLQPFLQLHHELAKYLLKVGDQEGVDAELDYLDRHAPDLAQDVRDRVGNEGV